MEVERKEGEEEEKDEVEEEMKDRSLEERETRETTSIFPQMVKRKKRWIDSEG